MALSFGKIGKSSSRNSGFGWKIGMHGPKLRERDVSLVKWGCDCSDFSFSSSSSPCFDFHSAHLIVNLEENDCLPKASTKGLIFSWVAMENEKLVKKGVVAHVSPFNYAKDLQTGDSYEYLGRTRFMNDKIQVLSEFFSY
jgi:hypothetical protein